MNLKHFVFNELGVNSFVLSDHTSECVIIDPGCNSAYEKEQLISYIKQDKLNPVLIINTHGHFDHVFGNAGIKAAFQCDLIMHKDDLHLIEHIDKYAGIFGFVTGKSPVPDRFINEGDQITFGESTLLVIHVPGHSPGSICLYSENDNLLICGDVLFNGSIGRTDLPGGNHNLLINGIKQKLLILPPETIVWPGHGPQTTIGHEHDTNPFLN